jgi:hypothetical protein
MVPDHPLSPGGRTFALLDANVLLPPRLSDVIFDLYGIGLFSAKWTESIEVEFLRNWSTVVHAARRKAESTPPLSAAEIAEIQSKAANRLRCYQHAVREYEVFGYDDPSVIAQLPRGRS